MKTYTVHYVEQRSKDYLVNADTPEDAKEALSEEFTRGLYTPIQCETTAAEVQEYDETLSDEEVDATSSNGLWTGDVRASKDALDSLPLDLTRKHYWANTLRHGRLVCTSRLHSSNIS